MNDLLQIKRQNEQAARRARFPLRIGNFRLKRQPKDLPNGTREEAVYTDRTDRTGREFFLSLEACTAWINHGTIPSPDSLIAFN